MRLLAAIALMMLSTAASARCECMCINGQVRPVCTAATDLAPVCGPQLCSTPPPSIRPIDAPALPPLGTTGCRSEQVYSQITRRYEWQRVCR